MIATIATHFELIKNCLLEIADAINQSFDNACLEIRMQAVKCLDVVGYWINMYLTNESKCFFKPENGWDDSTDELRFNYRCEKPKRNCVLFVVLDGCHAEDYRADSRGQ